MKKIIVLLYMLLPCKVFSQDLNLKGFSPNYYQTGNLIGNIGYNLNVSSISSLPQSISNKEYPAGQLHFVAQLLLIHKLSKHFTAGIGYAYGNHNIFGLKETEDRLLGQVGYLHSLSKVNFIHRLRFEYRTPKNLQTNITDNASILRYQTYATLPLYNPKDTKRGFYLSASNELFWYLEGASNGPVSSKNGVFEFSNVSEDWVHLAGGYNMGNTRVELGYCFQALIRNKQLDLRYLNLAQLNVYITINWDDLQSWWYL